jgi:hypothetical protein
VNYPGKVGIVPPTRRWFTTEVVGKLRVGGGLEKIVKKWLIFEIILGFVLPVFIAKTK